jgi:hypothetical protein
VYALCKRIHLKPISHFIKKKKKKKKKLKINLKKLKKKKKMKFFVTSTKKSRCVIFVSSTAIFASKFLGWNCTIAANAISVSA